MGCVGGRAAGEPAACSQAAARLAAASPPAPAPAAHLYSQLVQRAPRDPRVQVAQPQRAGGVVRQRLRGRVHARRNWACACVHTAANRCACSSFAGALPHRVAARAPAAGEQQRRRRRPRRRRRERRQRPASISLRISLRVPCVPRLCRARPGGSAPALGGLSETWASERHGRTPRCDGNSKCRLLAITTEPRRGRARGSCSMPGWHVTVGKRNRVVSAALLPAATLASLAVTDGMTAGSD